ncbi:hypothetical protein D9613_011989 [Agrocybe pediades]|uniref:Uncharacterized protein n=1 Tax=Agrocybe pediades TaxID=84607 RepID=A0A8H4VHU1_9AGAR|nr:hypothetical protein D9613_011989 [Agrocybe pediades]
MFAALVVQLPSTLFFKTPCSVWLRVEIFVEACLRCMPFATVRWRFELCLDRHHHTVHFNPIHNRTHGEELKTLWRCCTILRWHKLRPREKKRFARSEFLSALTPVLSHYEYTIKTSIATKFFSEVAIAMVEAEFNIHIASKELVSNLDSFPPTSLKNPTSSVVIFYRSKIDDAETQMRLIQQKIDIAKTSNKDLSASARRKLSLHGLSMIPSRRRQGGSEDSQEPCVSMDDDGRSSTGSEPPSPTFRTLFTTDTVI